jgi:hypothetical protein
MDEQPGSRPDSDEAERRRRFPASELRPARRVEPEGAPPLEPELVEEPPQWDARQPSGGFPFGGSAFGPRTFAGGRVKVYGCSPGCLLVSILVSLMLTLLLNALI